MPTKEQITTIWNTEVKKLEIDNLESLKKEIVSYLSKGKRHIPEYFNRDYDIAWECAAIVQRELWRKQGVRNV